MKQVYLTFLAAFLTLLTAAQTLTVNTGAALPPDHHSGPIYRSSAASGYYFSRFAYLYRDAELANMGGGSTITSVAWNKTSTGATTSTGKFRIYMKNSSTTDYTTPTPFSTLVPGATLVYSNDNQIIPATSGFLPFTLTTPFLYSGGSLEILVDWDVSTATGNASTGPFSWEKTTVPNSILGYASFAAITEDLSPATNSIGTITNTRPVIQLNYTSGAACSGAPLAGTATATRTQACAGLEFGVNITGATTGVSGLSYQWQSSSDNVNWTDISNATSSALTTSQTSSTWYRRRISCGANNAFSTSVQVTMAAPETIPYAESFESATQPNPPECITVEDINGGTSWFTGSVSPPTTFLPSIAMIYGYNATLPADDWFYTKGLTLTAGTTYQLKFRYGASDGPTYTEKLEVKYGTAPNAAAMTSSALFSNTNINNSATSADMFKADTTFTVPANGTYYVGFHAFSDADQAFLLVDSIEVLAPACSEPKNLSVANVSATGATVSWNPPSVGTPAGYQYAVTTSNMPPATGTAVTGTSVSVSGLTGSTLYYLYVRTNCGSGVSAWVTYQFTTPCPPVNVPYTQNFESAIMPALPECVTLEDLNGGTTWESTRLTAPTSYLPSTAMVYTYDPVLPGNDWFYTQGLNLTAGTTYQLKFRYGASNGPTYIENLEVKYGSFPSAAAMTSAPLFSNANIDNNLDSLQMFLADTTFTVPATGVYYLGFHAYSDPDQAYLFVDSIEVAAPTCSEPKNLVVSGISSNSATFSWDPPSVGVPAGYQYAVTTSNMPPATGTGVTGTTATITTLTGSTAYYVYVRTNCGTSTSPWTVTQFTTACGVVNIPYYQNFESAVVPALPECVTTQDLNGATSWATIALGSPTPYLPSTAMVYSYDAATPADDWFYTQGLNLTAGTAYQLKFKYGASDGPTYTEKLEVKYGSAPTATAMNSSPIFSNTNISNAATDLSMLTADTTFIVPATGTYFIGFHAFSAADMAFLFVDSLSVTQPLCSEPKNVFASGITASGATITWSGPSVGNPANYQYAISTSSTPPATGTTVTGTTVTVTTLNSNTVYYIYVRTNCGASTSDWASHVFQTPCAASQSIPYYENFSNVSVPGLGCNSAEDANQDATTWESSDVPTYLINGTQAMVYLYSPTETADDWFFTPALNLTAGTSYTLKFKYKGSVSYPEKLEVFYGTSSSSTAMTSASLFRDTAINRLDSTQVSFIPTSTGVYHIGFHAFSEPDMFYLSVDDIAVVETSALPVTLTLLKGEKFGNANKLIWSTVTEVNNKGFELQRSVDGRNFSSLGFVPSKASSGNSTSNISYDFTDSKTTRGTTYYRLMQVDKNDKTSYSNIISLKGDRVTSIVLTSLYPNPATNIVNVVVASPAAEKVSLVVTDLAGKVVMQNAKSLINGDNNLMLNVSTLPSGSYFVKVVCSNGCETAVSKFVK